MFPDLVRDQHVGANNVNWVLSYLEHHEVVVIDRCLVGNGYRKVSWTVGKEPPQVQISR